MHTLHYIAVEADSKQEAFDKVVIALQPNEDGYRLGDWSDWHVVGGGRFSSNAHKENKANPMGGSYTNDPADVISYTENKEKFQEVVKDILRFRSQSMNRNIVEIKTDKFISQMVDYASEGGRGAWNGDTLMNVYSIRQAAEMLMGSWTCDSGFYDLQEYVSEFEYLDQRLDKPEQAVRQYLVPVDFHF
jgi:hypothetical protein